MTPEAAFTPRDAGFEARVRASFARQRVMDLIGARLATVAPGHATIELPWREELTQQHGFVHGGIVATIADSAAGYAGMSLVGPGSGVLTVEFKLNLMSPADGERLEACGTVLRPGRTLQVTRADVYKHREGERSLCATLLQTLMTVEGRGERG
jgi:uncharacterized protein (TIGR00369 family)